MAKNTIKFYPYERKGLSKHIDDNSGARAQLNVSIKLKGTKVSDGNDEYFDAPSKTIQLVGPGDVLSINPSAIKFAAPPDSSSIALSYEYMPFIEFYESDFPWRYSAVKPQDGKLTPWIALIVCKEGEFTIRTDEAGRKILTIVAASTQDVLQPVFQELDSLAHAQVIDTTHGEISLSRILCNRKLTENTEYTAFLIPTFKQGQENGISGSWTSKAPATQLAWECGMNEDIEFPVYYTWSFSTGEEQFITLAEQLRPISSEAYNKLQAALNIDVTETGMRSYAYDEKVIKAESKASELGKTDYGILPALAALKKTTADSEPAASEETQVMVDKQQEELRKLLELSPVFSKNTNDGKISEDEDPWIVPPVYGARHMLSDVSDLAPNKNAKDNNLLSELNTDLRHRMAAGLGASIVQQNQEELMNRAWEQVEDVNRLNKIIREINQVDKVNATSERRLSERVAQRAQLNSRHRGLTTDAAVRLLSNSAIYGRSRNIDVNNVANDLSEKSPKRSLDERIGFPIMKKPSTERSQGIETETLNEIYNFIKDYQAENGLGNFDFLKLCTSGDISSILENLKDNLTFPEPLTQAQKTNEEEEEKAEEISYATEQGRIKVETILNAYKSSNYLAANLEQLLNAKNPVMAYPVFPEPTYFYLRELSTRYILPSVDGMAQNTISGFTTNLKFEEAFLCGMNTEMGQELLWREYPTDERGSYFRKFWDQDQLPENFDDDYYDIKPVSEWTGKLGNNHCNDNGSLYVFVIRGKLMRSFPETRVDLAIYNNDKGFQLQDKLQMTAWLTDDTFICGFKKEDIENLRAQYPDTLCLAFVEEAQSMRFCLNHENARNGNSAVYATSRMRENSIWGCPFKFIDQNN